jgi:hypothetical protein
MYKLFDILITSHVFNVHCGAVGFVVDDEAVGLTVSFE